MTRKHRLCVITIVGQVLMFRVSRESVARAMDWKGFSEQEIDTVQRLIVKQTQVILGVPDARKKGGR